MLLGLLLWPGVTRGELAPGSARFIRGDSNGDGKLSLADIFTSLRVLYGAPLTERACLDAADVDDSGELNTTDIIRLVTFIFYNTGFPPAPFPEPGVDPTEDAYDCSSPAGGKPKAIAVADRVAPDALAPGAGKAAPGLGCDGTPGQDIDFVRFAAVPVQGHPGQRGLRATVLLMNRMDVDGFTLSFFADPAKIRLETVSFENTVLEHYPPEWVLRLYHRAADGYLATSVLMDFAPPFHGKILPRGCFAPIAHLEFSLTESARVGDTIRVELRSTPGVSEHHPAIENELSVLGVSILPILGGVLVEVQPEASLFVRGDANRDGVLDIADSVLTLRILFLSAEVECQDPVDADDDGHLNITDVVYLTKYLFAGGDPPPYPFPNPGTDLSPDSLGDCR